MRRTASEVIRSLEMRVARLEKTSGRNEVLVPINDVEESFYEGFVEDVIEIYERGDNVIFALIETDEGYAIIRDDSYRGWDLDNRFSSLRKAESHWENMTEEFDKDWD